ncbi:hypothetical protein [Bordetella genomosp. 13]|uniref:hypothetical protein n=1 Tax=Bordetella genomosp. 13 TaxID=463040 RepID=UPI0011AB11DE|nr:hypothetical protein [Bordetella genomosp. 13]
MNQNHLIYKGYRLTASVKRTPGPDAARPAFTATVTVALPGDQDMPGVPQAVPRFASGATVSSPHIAVDAAIDHGRCVVDGYRRPA